MPVRSANAEWRGDLKAGKGTISTETNVLSNSAYNFSSRFEDGKATNPEELLGAAHAACFSMALANTLSKAGFKVISIKTEDKVHIEKVGEGLSITKIIVNTVGDVEGIDETAFIKQAEETKNTCIVSRALTGPMITLNASLKS